MNIEWEKISTQNTFESLVRALLSLEAPNARLFSRPGADQGIDGLDQVTNTVYQLKFHKNGASSKPIQDANAELAKITRYRQIDPKPLWKSITQWVLITNVADNPQTTHQRWQDEIVPKFRNLNLNAVLWTTIELEQMLLRHKHIYVEFFESEARHYLSLNEAIASLNNKGLRDNEYNTVYRERESDRGDFDAFLNSTSSKVFVVWGPGGVGKTRYLLECGLQAQTSWPGNVYWANTAALESTKNFLGGVLADTANLIFIDEPSDPKFINVLLEQLSNPESRISKWKICIALRSQKDTMHAAVFQRQYRNLLVEKNLQELSDTQIEQIVAECAQVSGMNSEQMHAITQRIVNLSNGFPIWVHVALKMIEDGFDPNRIPEDRYNVAREYIEQLVNNVPGQLCEPSQMSVLVKWLGLFRDLNTSDDDAMRFLNLELSLDRTKSISDLIDYLLTKRFISKFGRLVKIKPDVIRDHVIFHALGKPSNQPDTFETTSFGKELGKRILNERIPQFQKLLTSIDLAEVYFKRTDGNSLGILNAFGKELVETAKTGNTFELGTLLELSKSFSYSQPKIIAQLSLAIRSHEPVEAEIDDKIWGKQTIKASTLISKLPDLLKEASRYCIDQSTRDQLVREAIELLKHEVSKELKGEKLPNDGARSSHCIQKMIYGGPNFFSSYQNEFKGVALEYIDSIGSLNEIDKGSLKAIISPLV